MLRPFWVRRARIRRRRRELSTFQFTSTIESLESRIVLSASTLAGGGHEHGPAGVDVPYGVFTPEEIAAMEAIPFDSSLSTKPPAGPMPIADGAHEADILTIVLDFKEGGQANTFDIFGNEVSTFDVTAYGFLAGDFNTVADAVLAEVNEDYYDELAGTVGGPIGQDLRIDFIIGDIGVAPVGISEYYYVQIGSGVSGDHIGSLGVAGGSVVRNSGGSGPNGVSVGDVVASVFTDSINGLGGVGTALTSGDLVATTMAISGTTSHEVGHTVSLSHINKAGSTQPSPGVSPLMGTGAIDLPNADRITDREFSISGVDGQNGNAPRMHIQQLVDAISLHSTAGAGPGSIAGTKFNDLNNNGFRDAGEPGLSGWTIYVDANNNGVFDSIAGGVEPDDFAQSQNVSTVDPNVTLSEVENDNTTVTNDVFAVDDSSGFASTGTRMFVGTFTSWAESIPARLRMDFNVDVTSVSIDAIGDDPSDFGVLQIFGAGDILLDTYITADLGEGVAETMTLSSETLIAYAVAYGQGGQTVRLDNLVYSATEESTVTDVNGDYLFPLLAEGSHQLGEIPQAGWIQTAPQYGRLFAVDQTTDEIVEIDPTTGLETNRFSHPGAASAGADGLAFNGTSLFFTDRIDLFELNPNDGTVLDTDSLATVGAGADIDGLAVLNGQLVALDFANDLIVYIDPTSDLATSAVALDASIDGAGGFTGAASRGTLFVTDLVNDLIYEVNATTGATINSFAIPSVGAPDELGLAFVNGSLFVGDNAGNLNELDPNTGASTGLGTVAFPGSDFSALGGDGGTSGIWSVYVAGQNVTGIDFGNWEDTLPAAISTVINGGSDNRSGINTLTIQFNAPVTIGSPADLVLFNHTDGVVVPVPDATLTNNGTTAVTWNLHENEFDLPDGYYTAELVSTAATPNLGQTASFLFWKLYGDIDGDAAVNFNDTVPLSLNFGATGQAEYSDGDGDGDGNVNFNDTVPLSLGFGTSLTPPTLDFGDAPDPMFATLEASDGARHIITGNSLTLGGLRDGEADGQQSADATGDDTLDLADEDGVVINNGGVLETETSVDVDVTSSGNGFLNVWIDYNDDQDWDDAGEHVVDDLAVVNGPNTVGITAPLGTQGTVIARFRLTGTSGYSYTGLAPDGEVEDHEIIIDNASGPAADTESTFAVEEGGLLDFLTADLPATPFHQGGTPELSPLNLHKTAQSMLSGRSSLASQTLQSTFPISLAFSEFSRNIGDRTVIWSQNRGRHGRLSLFSEL